MTTDHKDLPQDLAHGIKASITELARGVKYPDLMAAVDQLATLADRAQRVAPAEVLEEAMRLARQLELANQWGSRENEMRESLRAYLSQHLGAQRVAPAEVLEEAMWLAYRAARHYAEFHQDPDLKRHPWAGSEPYLKLRDFLSQHLGAQRVEQAEPVATVRGFSMGGSPIIDWVDWIDGPRVRPGAKLYTTPPASAPGFSPMHLAPIDGTSVLLYMPTCGDKFAVGQFHSDGPDTIRGHWGDDEGGFYVHEPVAFMALNNLARLLGPVATTTTTPDAPTAQAAPARTAGDAAQGEREATAKALEFAEYMAKGAEQMLESLAEESELRLRREESDDVDDDDMHDATSTCSERAGGLRTDIYEFRKRAEKARAALAARPGEMGAEEWAELYRLREAVKGPDGFATWQDAATDERIRRVKAERALAARPAAAPEPEPVAWWFHEALRSALREYSRRNPSRYLNAEQVAADNAEFAAKLHDCWLAAAPSTKGGDHD